MAGPLVGASLITGPFVSGHLYVTLQFFFYLFVASKSEGWIDNRVLSACIHLYCGFFVQLRVEIFYQKPRKVVGWDAAG